MPLGSLSGKFTLGSTSNGLRRGIGADREPRRSGREQDRAILIIIMYNAVSTRMRKKKKKKKKMGSNEDHFTKTVSINHNFGRERRTEAGNRTNVVRLPARLRRLNHRMAKPAQSKSVRGKRLLLQCRVTSTETVGTT